MILELGERRLRHCPPSAFTSGVCMRAGGKRLTPAQFGGEWRNPSRSSPWILAPRSVTAQSLCQRIGQVLMLGMMGGLFAVFGILFILARRQTKKRQAAEAAQKEEGGG